MVDELHRSSVRLPNLVTKHVFVLLLPHQRFLISFWSDSVQNFMYLSGKKGYPLEEISSNWKIQIQKQYSKIDIHSMFMMIDSKGNLLQFLSLKSDNNFLLLTSESPRYGKEWSPFIALNSPEQYWEVKNKGVLLEYGPNIGRIIIPIYDLICNRIFMLISQDNGRSWSSSLFIEPTVGNMSDLDKVHECSLVDLLDQANNPANNPRSGTYDPLIIEGSNGQLLCLCRQNGDKHLYYTKSFDSGETWEDLEPYQTLFIDPNTPFDGINIRTPTHELSSIALIVGLSTVEGITRLVLFTIDFDLGTQMERLVIESDILQLKGLQLVQDENGIIHIFYIKNDENLQWIDFDPKILCI